MAEIIIAPDWLIQRQAMYGSRVTPLWSYAHGKKSAMIVLSGHFKTLINILWNPWCSVRVLNYMVITVDHCTLTYSRSIVCYIPGIKETVIVCLRFHCCTSGPGNCNVCAAIVPFVSITFVSVCQLSPLCAINVCTPTTGLKFCRYLNNYHRYSHFSV